MAEQNNITERPSSSASFKTSNIVSERISDSESENPKSIHFTKSKKSMILVSDTSNSKTGTPSRGLNYSSESFDCSEES